MVQRMEIYKCGICGNVVEVFRGGKGALVCCGKPMQLEAENTTDAAQEKHVPLVEKVEEGFKVTVGSTLHPMEEKHLIEWIELDDGETIHRKHLRPGEPPVVVFRIRAEKARARAYCNLHGLWRG